MAIYVITNKLNDKRYVGQTIGDVKRRWSRHCGKEAKYQSRIQRAIQKYGKENFLFEVWEKDIIKDIDHLNEREIFWILSLGTLSPNGYNLVTGGKNCKALDETRERIRQANLGNTNRVGRKHTEETKDKLRQAMVGRVSNRKGCKLTEDTKNKIGNANRGKSRDSVVSTR